MIPGEKRAGRMYIFGEKHEIFRKGVQRFVASEISPNISRWERDEYFPVELMPKLGAMGCLGITFPEEYGGAADDWTMSLVFHEELSRCTGMGIPISVTAHTDMSLPHIARLGTDQQKKRYLAPAVKGETLAGVWVTEPQCGSDVAAIKTTAVRSGNHYIINGSKQFSTNALKGDFGIMLVRTGEADSGHRGLTMLIVETSSPGFKAVPIRKMALKSGDTGTIYLDNVRVPVENRLDEENRGFYNQMIGFERERLSLAATAVGSAQVALDEAVHYARDRKAFGRPISKFQAISHRLVDIAVTLEAARQLMYRAVEMFCSGVEGKQDATTKKMCYMAKLFATDAAQKLVSDAAQIFGGSVVDDDLPVSRLYRDIRIGTLGGGTSQIMRNILGGLMGL